MKYTLAIAAILGLASVEQVQAIQLEGDDSESDHSKEYFPAGMDEMLGDGIVGEYKRVTPPRFAEDTDDVFMRSMIENYALEAKNKDGTPSGKFWMDKEGARAAAAEVLETHKGLKGDDLHLYLETYFPRTWNHFDVN